MLRKLFCQRYVLTSLDWDFAQSRALSIVVAYVEYPLHVGRAHWLVVVAPAGELRRVATVRVYAPDAVCAIARGLEDDVAPVGRYNRVVVSVRSIRQLPEAGTIGVDRPKVSLATENGNVNKPAVGRDGEAKAPILSIHRTVRHRHAGRWIFGWRYRQTRGPLHLEGHQGAAIG